MGDWFRVPRDLEKLFMSIVLVRRASWCNVIPATSRASAISHGSSSGKIRAKNFRGSGLPVAAQSLGHYVLL